MTTDLAPVTPSARSTSAPPAAPSTTPSSSHWQMIVDEVARFPEDVRALPVAPLTDGLALRAELAERYRFDVPVSLDLLTADVMGLLRAHTVHVTHPRYFGLFNPSVREAGVVADTLAALYNPQLAAWSHAPAAVELERLALHHLARQLGLDPDAGAATFTTGGAEGNLTAVLAALAAHFPEAARLGVAALPVRPAVYVSAETHHSFVKVLRMTGLGTDALRVVPTTAEHALDPTALAACVREDRQNGWHPLLVVGTAGTTSAGIIDPLPALAAVARDIGAWFHVDAAWGGLAALSPRLRPLLTGIEEADSVTWDAHKGLSVPMGAGMFFSRHVAPLRAAFAVTTSYMPAPHEDGGCAGEVFLDPYATTVQWSRRAIGLKVFMALAELGASGYATLVEHQAAMGELLRERLTAAGWVIVNRTTLPIVCCTHPRIRAGDRTAAAVAGAVQESGRAWVSEVVLGDESVVRACVTSYHTTPADVEVLVNELIGALDRAAVTPSVSAPPASSSP